MYLIKFHSSILGYCLVLPKQHDFCISPLACAHIILAFFFGAAALVIVLPSLFLIVFGAHCIHPATRIYLCIYTQVFRDLGYAAV